jgi:hypothetical protein
MSVVGYLSPEIANHPEAEVAVAMILRRELARRSAQIHARCDPPTAPHAAEPAIPCLYCRAIRRQSSIRFIPTICHPFGHITMNMEYTPRIGGQRIHRPRAAHWQTRQSSRRALGPD